MDEENRWFRYRHLFKEFLNNKFLQESSSLQQLLWRRVGEWYKENGYISEAYSKLGVTNRFAAVKTAREMGY